jgi:membrane protease YdiL (CAAX protease family)
MQTTSLETSDRLSNGSSRGALAAWLGVAALLVALGFVGTSTGQSDPNVLYDYSFAVGSTIIYAILVAVSFGIASALGRPFVAAGLAKFSWSWTWKAVGLIVVVLVVAQLLEPLLHAGEKQGLEPSVWRPDRAPAFALNALVASTVVPFAEELFFRGVGVRALLRFGGPSAIGVTALVFGLGHGILAALPVLVLFGAALGWVRLRSDSVWPGMIAHGFFNGFALFIVYVNLT